MRVYSYTLDQSIVILVSTDAYPKRQVAGRVPMGSSLGCVFRIDRHHHFDQK